jgi:hypothetical protein
LGSRIRSARCPIWRTYLLRPRRLAQVTPPPHRSRSVRMIRASVSRSFTGHLSPVASGARPRVAS